MALPKTIESYLMNTIFGNRQPAYLLVGTDGLVMIEVSDRKNLSVEEARLTGLRAESRAISDTLFQALHRRRRQR